MIHNFFQPKSIAVIGASSNPEKLGNVIIRNLLSYHYRGKVYPVNPKGGTIEKKRAYARVQEIQQPVDLAVIVVPAAIVPEVLHDCWKKRIRSAIIISAGFGEIGKQGKQLEATVLRLAKKYSIQLLGPNCLGLIIPKLRCNASFAKGMPADGSVAIISQSGAMAVAITDWALSTHIGFSALVSLGNKADITEFELLKFFESHHQTKVVALYLESLSHGRSFLRLLQRVTKRKPVIILLPGKSKEARQAVASHTGALAGSQEVLTEALRSAGACIAKTLEELFMYAELFSIRNKISGRRIAIVTNAGGPGILATDAVKAQGLSLAVFAQKTVSDLERVLPQSASTHNPIDVVGDASAETYNKALRIALADPRVDACITLLTNQYITRAEQIAKYIIAAQKDFPRKTVLASFIGGASVQKPRELLREGNIAHFDYPEQAVQAARALVDYATLGLASRQFPDTPLYTKPPVPIMGKKAERVASRFMTGILPSVLIRSMKEISRAIRKIGFPCVAKVVSAKALHKTDAGFVAVNILNEVQLEEILSGWQRSLSFRFSRDEGFLLQPYRPSSLEVFVGAKRDPNVGPYCLVGLGGIFVESLKLTAISPLPMTAAQADECISRSPLGAIFSSNRGAHFSKSSLIKVLLGVSKMMMDKPSIQECDLNPVMMHKDSCLIADIRLLSSSS